MTTIAFPSLTRVPGGVDIGIQANTQVSTSDLSGVIETRELPGARWFMRFRFDSLDDADARKLQVLISQLRGQANRVRVPVWTKQTPLGSWAGVPLVKGGGQTGATINLDGFTPFATVRAGDLFNLGATGELKMVTADGTADSGGELLVTFEPPIRSAPADNTAISTTPVVPLMVARSPILEWHSDPGVFSDFSFDLIEAF